ncbi:MAG: M15 family metallopeptidase, partial [Spirochaetaceae bacterium]|nr:M15 family metallopeptidase [Spirochaetaceae bacterium]
VDKTHPLPEDYVPAQLVELDGYSRIRTARNGLVLDLPATDALEKLSAAAEEDDINLMTTSAYRSYDYQENLFTSYVEKDGIESAERYSAGAGMSQHQLGTTVDFGSITNSFAESEAGRWLTAESANHGWSLSFPKGFEQETGYMWESWHWRWIGADAAAMQDRYFDGIQQRLLEFWHENETIFQEALRE